MNFINLNLNNDFPEMDIAPSDWHLGETPEIDVCNIQVRIAEQPTALNYYRLCDLKQQNLPEEYKLLFERFDLWLINHTVGIIDNSVNCNIIEFGYKINFDKDYKVQILEMMPQTSFIKPILSGGFEFSIDAKANGELNPQNEAINLKPIPILVSGGIKTQVLSNLGIRLSFPTLSPLIQASGQNSKYGEWSIKKEEKPLVGDQILSQILLTEKGLPSLKFKSCIYVTIKKFEFLIAAKKVIGLTLPVI